ncbi:nucleoside diphosphate kinase [Gracilibacillus ureilyticus]|uniref:Nucleoside diphosphate kinase n=2 Tax=Gracilibacillus ureilyticus TaxID=531814 RepID=A0A1H9LQ91_9BACI|nr:nucleoside diphosphate kinase [Gracilibacillus ureilyticus]
MIKPDAVQRNLVGEIVSRFEKKGFKLIGAKLMHITEQQAEKHYSEHKGKSFYNQLVDFITSGPVFAMVWEGKEVIATARKMMGKTNPQEADTGTIRGDYGVVTHRNIIHGSDSEESAQREIALFFHENELLDYKKDVDNWLM